MKLLMKKMGFLVLTLALGYSHNVTAAGPVTHAFVTELFFQQFPDYDKAERTSFRLGTLFPDIRYLGTISRDQTHFPEMTLEEVLEERDPFLAGMKFHSYVDIEREDYITRGGYYELVSDLGIEQIAFFLKLVEDEIVYPSLEKKEWKSGLKELLPEELLWGVEEKTVKRWHNILHYFFAYHPSTLIHHAHLQGKGFQHFSAKEVKRWDQHLSTVAHEEQARTYVNALLKMFNEKIKAALQKKPFLGASQARVDSKQ